MKNHDFVGRHTGPLSVGLRADKKPGMATRLIPVLLAGTALATASPEASADDIFFEDGPAQAQRGVESVEMAQSTDDKDEEKNQTFILEPITIDGKVDVILGGVQLDAEDIERKNPQTLRDVFRQEPGVTVGSPMPVSQKVYVNGIEDTNLAVDIDGARQANKTYHHQGTTIIDPGMFKAVKVESGVAPADAGPMALAGSMSLETKDGRDLVAPGNAYGGFGKFSFNNNGTAFSEEAALATQQKGFDVLGYGMKEWGNDFNDGDNNDVEGTRPSATNFIGKLGYTAQNGYRVKAAFTRYDDIALRDARTNFSTVTNGFLTTSQHDYSRQQMTVSFGDETPTEMWDPKFSLSHTRTHLDSFQHANNRSIIARVESTNGKLSNTFSTGYGKVTSGVDYFRDNGSGGVSSSGSTTLSERVENYGLFTQVRTSWTDDLRTSLGGRVDHNRFEGNDGTELNNTGLSGNLNAEYDFTDIVMGYAGGSTVFGGIPLTEVGIQQSTYDYEDVEPSRSYNGKIGANVAVSDVTLDGHVFYTFIRDAHSLTTSDRSQNFNVKSTGGNASARYDYGNGFLRAGYSRVTFRVDGEVPTSGGGEYYYGSLLGDMVSFEAEHRFPVHGVRIGSISEFWFENDDTESLTGEALNSYFLWNIYGEWRPEQLEGLQLRLDVHNLLNRTYAHRANTAVYTTNAAVSAFNEPGRSIIVSAKYEF